MIPFTGGNPNPSTDAAGYEIPLTVLLHSSFIAGGEYENYDEVPPSPAVKQWDASVYATRAEPQYYSEINDLNNSSYWNSGQRDEISL